MNNTRLVPDGVGNCAFTHHGMATASRVYMRVALPEKVTCCYSPAGPRLWVAWHQMLVKPSSLPSTKIAASKASHSPSSLTPVRQFVIVPVTVSPRAVLPLALPPRGLKISAQPLVTTFYFASSRGLVVATEPAVLFLTSSFISLSTTNKEILLVARSDPFRCSRASLSSLKVLGNARDHTEA